MAIKTSPEIESPEKTSSKRSGGWFTRVWYRIKLALAGDDETLLVENRTAISWKIYHDYHMLGIIDGSETRVFRLQKHGNFNVRPGGESDAVEYLVLNLNERMKRVEIYRRHMGSAVEVYEMRAA